MQHLDSNSYLWHICNFLKKIKPKGHIAATERGEELGFEKVSSSHRSIWFIPPWWSSPGQNRSDDFRFGCYTPTPRRLFGGFHAPGVIDALRTHGGTCRRTRRSLQQHFAVFWDGEPMIMTPDGNRKYGRLFRALVVDRALRYSIVRVCMVLLDFVSRAHVWAGSRLALTTGTITHTMAGGPLPVGIYHKGFSDTLVSASEQHMQR